MIFLSAQPDTYYFLWQLELQLFNFHQLRVPRENVHVLITFDPQRELRKEFQALIDENQYATFFTYPDKRESKNYPSSIRPHIIKQHLIAFPALHQEAIFYHDSDILLSALPDFEGMLPGETWYVSDTRSYIDSRYIKSAAGEKLFYQMCDIVHISPQVVMADDENAGGAQYLLKNISYAFWDKVEKDCESIYKLLSNHNTTEGEKYYIETGNPVSKYHGIQAWCADMWAVLWNAWLFGYEVKIHTDIDFCWPYDSLNRKKKILHYSGKVDKENEKLFCKTRYIHYPPYYDHIEKIDKNTCSSLITGIIRQYLKEKNNRKVNLKDVTFLIPVRIDSEERLENLSMVIRYLDKYFDTHVLIAEADKDSKVSGLSLPDCCHLIFIEDHEPVFHHTCYNNLLTVESATPIIAIYDTDVVFSTSQILEAVTLIRNGKADYVSPYDGAFVSVDRLFKAMFGKLFDAELLQHNVGKFGTGTYRSWGGTAFLNRQFFIDAGMDNEKIDSWGPEDIERMKRMQILGYVVKRIKGPLFHLPHPSSLNSGYHDLSIRIRLMEEYLKISSMRKEELKEYVGTWHPDIIKAPAETTG
ncbi:MAG: hypothetical protein EPN37_02585 [Chitinophagaceae bacterium]|nr:MAG: hypothetical protein EPN37_02585 [Chitinophagaceae bacterium]